MKRTLRLPGAKDGAQLPEFFRMCGSPIRTDLKLAYEDNEESKSDDVANVAQLTPATPPLGDVCESRRPITQWPPTPRGARWGDEDDLFNDSRLEDLEKGVLREEDGIDVELENKKAAPVSLAVAQAAGIPCFTEPWIESKADLPSHQSPTGSPVPSHMRISFRELRFGRVLGVGGFGKVYRATWRGRTVAVKMLIRQNLSECVLSEFEKEIKIMSYLHHPNICRLLGACFEPKHRALIVELVPRGSLWSVLRVSRKKLTIDVRCKMVIDIARGMQYLHSFERPILHRDMKSPNLLVEKDYSIKISDFGLSRVKAQIQTMTGNCGTTQWMAPEVLGNRKYTEKADVYSFAIVVWEIFTGRCPYDGMTQIQAALSVLNHDYRPSIPTSCPRFFVRLITVCWQRNPELRPSFDQIVGMCERNFRM